MSTLEEINLFFNSLLHSGVLIQRYKRFLADVRLDDGTIVTAHCANTGAMLNCAEPGWPVWLSYSDNPKRKLAYSWELVRNDLKEWIVVNTLLANKVVGEGLTLDLIAELSGYQHIKREVRFGLEKSRVDFLLSDPKKSDCYLEVKSVTLLDNGQGYFPDAVTVRGQKHLRELSNIAQQGKRAVLLFCVQHSGVSSVSVASHIDQQYADELQAAMHHGVEILAYSTNISPEKILINQRIPFICKFSS